MRKKILGQQITCDGWFNASHARVCRLHLAAYDHLTGQIAELDQLIAEPVAPFRRLSAGLVTIPGPAWVGGGARQGPAATLAGRTPPGGWRSRSVIFSPDLMIFC